MKVSEKELDEFSEDLKARRKSPEAGYKEYLASKIVSGIGLISLIAGFFFVKNFGIYFIVFGIVMLLTGVWFFIKKF